MVLKPLPARSECFIKPASVGKGIDSNADATETESREGESKLFASLGAQLHLLGCIFEQVSNAGQMALALECLQQSNRMLHSDLNTMTRPADGLVYFSADMLCQQKEIDKFDLGSLVKQKPSAGVMSARSISQKAQKTPSSSLSKTRISKRCDSISSSIDIRSYSTSLQEVEPFGTGSAETRSEELPWDRQAAYMACSTRSRSFQTFHDEHAQEVQEAEDHAENLDLANSGWTRDVLRQRVSMLSKRTYKRKLQEFVLWEGFDVGIGIVIIANAATMGIEAEQKARGHTVPHFLGNLDLVFLFIYLFELLTRLYCFRWKALLSRFIQLDMVLVGSGFVDFFALNACPVTCAPAHWLSTMVILRMTRVARLARLVRLMTKFKVLWELVQGLFHCLGALFWTFVIIAIFLYIFAIIALELIHRDVDGPGDYNQSVDAYFNDLFSTVLTLLQGLTLDSLGGVYRPIIMHNPWLICYFLCFILVVSIALMNLITAIMVESAMAQSAQEKEIKTALERAKKEKNGV